MPLVQIPHKLKQEQVGTKAWNLQLLHEAGHAVPPFVVLPTTTTQKIVTSPDTVNTACQQIRDQLGTKRPVAIRSSALNEDTAHTAQAGQFHTILAVDPEEIADALLESVRHPKNQNAATNGTLALIVQTYLPPEQLGVLFTRDPHGKQSTVVEYTNDGSVVDGDAVTHLNYHPNHPPSYPAIPHLAELTKLGQKIEAAWQWPQDIEWVVYQNKLYILQTRDITSITTTTWYGLLAAEDALSNRTTPYLYQQTPVTEQFHHPRPLSVCLLQTLYAVDGPVAITYRRLGITYHPQQLHQMIAGALYTDREAELHTIFPALSLYTKPFGQPRLASWRGSGATLKNFLASTFLRTHDTKKLRRRLETALQDPIPNVNSPIERWKEFLTIYPLIYEVSLRTQKALSLLPKNQPLPPGSIDHAPLKPQDYDLSHEETVGNSLSLDDTSPFTFNLSATNTNIRENASAREVLRTRARTYLALREYTRWLTVKHLHQMRQDLHTYARHHIPHAPDLIFYATWDELVHKQFYHATLQARAEAHHANQPLTPPAILSSHTLTTSHRATAGLSPGKAQGLVRTVNELEDTIHTRQILYTHTLYPELTRHFSSLAGIITAEGGVLSHLAIMAREHGLPIIKSTIPFEELNERVVEIDGDTGTLNTKERTNVEC